MQAEFRQLKPEIELATLYRRRETVSALIRSLERYERARVVSIQDARGGIRWRLPMARECGVSTDPVRSIARA